MLFPLDLKDQFMIGLWVSPWRKIFDGTETTYPGHARILAPTLGYQRFWWKGVYTSVYALNAFEKYFDENNK